MCKNPCIMLSLLFILCVSLPFLFKCIEGLDTKYDTKYEDSLPKFTIPEDELNIADDMYKKQMSKETQDLSYNTLPLF